MAININTQSLFPVRRDKQVTPTFGTITYGSGGGGGTSDSSIDLTGYLTEASINVGSFLSCDFVWSGGQIYINDFFRPPFGGGDYIANASLGSTFKWTAGILDVSNYVSKTYVDGSLGAKVNLTLFNSSIGALTTRLNTTDTSLFRLDASVKDTVNGLSVFIPEVSLNDSYFKWNAGLLEPSVAGGGISQAYVDGSLATRDSSIIRLFSWELAQDSSITGLRTKDTNIDTSLNSIWTKLSSVDTSLLNLGTKNANQDTSINGIWTKLGSVDTSLLNLGTKNANQDTSINNIWTKFGSVDTSLNNLAPKVNPILTNLTVNGSTAEFVKFNATGVTHALLINRTDSGAIHLSFNNPSTGTALTDGTDVGIEADGTFRLRQQENLPVEIYTNNIHRWSILANGNLVSGTDGTAAYNIVTAGTVSGSGSGVSQAYVDGSLATRDVSIAWLNTNKLNLSGGTLTGNLNGTSSHWSGDVSIVGTLYGGGDPIQSYVNSSSYYDGSLNVRIKDTSLNMSKFKWVGGLLEPSVGTSSGWTVVMATADQLRTNNSSLIDSTYLQVTTTANKKYHIRFRVFLESDNATADIKYRIYHATGTTTRVRRVMTYAIPAGTSATYPTVTPATAFDSVDRTLLATVTGYSIVYEDIFLQVGATGGTVKFAFAQNTATAGASVTLYQGSFVEYIEF